MHEAVRVVLVAGAVLHLGACERGPSPESGAAAQVGKSEESTSQHGDAAAAPPPTPAQKVEAPPGWPSGSVVANVGQVELRSDAFFSIYNLKLEKFVSRGREMPEAAAHRYRSSILDRITHQELLRQEAARVGFQYASAELQARVVQQKRGVRDWNHHLERRGESDASLEAIYVAELREQGILRLAGELTVTAAEAKKEYEARKGGWNSSEERIRASHILVPVGGASGLSDADAKTKIEKLHAEASKPGADFGELARAHSTGPSSAKRGDLGILTRDRMAAAFSDAAFKLKIGEVSGPVKTKFGYHLILLAGRWPRGVLPPEAVADEIVTRIEKRKLYAARRALKERLAEGTAVQWWLDLESGEKLSEGRPPESITPAVHGHSPTEKSAPAPN
ncbi:MAG: peptidylprolyl isomerase [Nannocystaceae bacterium]|nr:peptidylprolyl isomerase [Nannocystaceae bacterium]